MQILIRGDRLQRLRLVSGLVLFAFVSTHFLNHALGLISLDAMDTMQAWRKLFTRSWLGSGLLVSAALIHVALALYKNSRRLTWRMPFWEAAQVAAGFAIPFFLIKHVVFNHGAAILAGTADTYTYELGNIWPDLAWEHALLLIIVWVHGCIGMHYWLRLAGWYRPAQPLLLALAVALPLSALAGFSVAGRQVAARLHDPAEWSRLQSAAQAPDADAQTALSGVEYKLRAIFLALLGLAIALPVARTLARAAAPTFEVNYRDGPVVRTQLGPTLLEVSRINGVPHTSVCGGRGRCSTCRVRVDNGLDALPLPEEAEATTLASINAPPHVRLACQIRPQKPITVTRLVAPPNMPRRRRPSMEPSQGTERNLAILFVDTRGFTAISEKRLPYDIVFILNRLFAEIGEAIERHGGVIDKYLGDGLMAIFGIETDDVAGCRQALRAVRDIDLALDRLNRELEGEIGAPLKLGMGLEVGPLVVGRIGHERTASMTVIGNTVNTASRLEALSKEKACQLVVSTDVLGRAGLDVPEFPREVVAIRGLTVPRQVALILKARDLPAIPG